MVEPRSASPSPYASAPRSPLPAPRSPLPAPLPPGAVRGAGAVSKAHTQRASTTRRVSKAHALPIRAPSCRWSRVPRRRSATVGTDGNMCATRPSFAPRNFVSPFPVPRSPFPAVLKPEIRRAVWRNAFPSGCPCGRVARAVRPACDGAGKSRVQLPRPVRLLTDKIAVAGCVSGNDAGILAALLLYTKPDPVLRIGPGC
jgi:hypothetical protein